MILTPRRSNSHVDVGGPTDCAPHLGLHDTKRHEYFLRLLDGTLSCTFYYQPIVDLRRSVVAGYEALARFPQEIGLPPDQCIAYAAKCGFGPQLEVSLLCKALSARELLPPNSFLTVNVSSTLLLSDQWLEVFPTLDNLAGVVFEITEQDEVVNYDEMRRRLEAVRASGASIAVDDIGSGYASLKHVMELKPNFVKLDRFFVEGCHLDRSKALFIEMIGTTADRLDAWIIAEGVETATELDELMRLGIPLVQGFYLGRPTPEMRTLQADTAASLRSRVVALSETETLKRHTDICPTSKSRQQASQMMATNNMLDLTAVVDKWNRPIEFIERHPLMGIRFLEHGMKAQLASRPAEVLQRALTRSEAKRFDPIAVIDEFGMFIGAVRIDRLMASILAE